MVRQWLAGSEEIRLTGFAMTTGGVENGCNT